MDKSIPGSQFFAIAHKISAKITAIVTFNLVLFALVIFSPAQATVSLEFLEWPVFANKLR
jgi:hypothetical protein